METDISRSGTTFTFSVFRYFFFWWIMLVLVYHVSGLILYLITQNYFVQTAYVQQLLIYIRNTWWITSIVYMTFGGVGMLSRAFLFHKVCKISITDAIFEGQDSPVTPKISKSLTLVNRERTKQRSFFHKLLCYRNIWFTDGGKFVLHEYAFRADEVRFILKKIGCD